MDGLGFDLADDALSSIGRDLPPITVEDLVEARRILGLTEHQCIANPANPDVCVECGARAPA